MKRLSIEDLEKIKSHLMLMSYHNDRIREINKTYSIHIKQDVKDSIGFINNQIKKLRKEASIEEDSLYVNFYRCLHCRTEWVDTNSCSCTDKCPSCNKEITPYKSHERS